MNQSLTLSRNMNKPIITSMGNPLIKQACALHQKKGRIESGLFLVEGIHHVGEAVSSGWEVETVLYAPELLTSEFARDLLTRLPTTPQPVSPQVMAIPGRQGKPAGHAGHSTPAENYPGNISPACRFPNADTICCASLSTGSGQCWYHSADNGRSRC